MRVLVQKSLEASVKVDGKIIGAIDSGLVLLVGFTEGDNEEIIDKMISKTINLRIFEDENGVMNKSFLEVGGSILSISQFTLYADVTHGNRPSFSLAEEPNRANELYEYFCECLANNGVIVKRGIFGGDMTINQVNQGPVTIIYD